MWWEKRCHCRREGEVILMGDQLGSKCFWEMQPRSIIREQYDLHFFFFFFFPLLFRKQSFDLSLFLSASQASGTWHWSSKRWECSVLICFMMLKKKQTFTVFLSQVQNKVNWGNRETGDTTSTFKFVVMLYILHKCFTVYLCCPLVPFDRKHGYLRRILIKSVDSWKKKRSPEDLVLVFTTIFKYGNMSLSLVYRVWVLLFKNQKVKKNVSVKLLIPS